MRQLASRRPPPSEGVSNAMGRKPLQHRIEDLLFSQDVRLHEHPNFARGPAIAVPIQPNGLGGPIIDMPGRPRSGYLIFGSKAFQPAFGLVVNRAGEIVSDSGRQSAPPEACLAYLPTRGRKLSGVRERSTSDPI